MDSVIRAAIEGEPMFSIHFLPEYAAREARVAIRDDEHFLILRQAYPLDMQSADIEAHRGALLKEAQDLLAQFPSCGAKGVTRVPVGDHGVFPLNPPRGF